MAEMMKLGGLVALEGDANLIATQLLFLPPSTKVLIMPPLADDIQTSGDTFDPRKFVRDVHTAFKNRSETARSFLECSADGQPRLAFLNGGCISAAAICILAICENQTNGDITKAEALFQEIVGEGVSGLMAEDNVDLPNTEYSETDVKEAPFGCDKHKPSLCPSLTAMRAADALDRETADLQHFAHDEARDGLHFQSTSNFGSSMSWTSSVSSQDFRHNPYIRRSTSASDICAMRNPMPVDTLLNTIDTAITTIRNRALSLDAAVRKRESVIQIDSPSCHEEALPRSAWSPDTDIRSSQTATPSVFEFRTHLVDVQSTHRQSTRSRSLDLRHSRQLRRSLTLPMVEPTTKRHLSCDGRLGRSMLVDDYSPSSISGRSTRTSCIGPSKTTTEKPQPSVRHYVDRGTYAEDILASQVASEERDFEPVFPMMEDLVIQLRTDSEDRIFDDTFRSYKNFSYPVVVAADDESLTSRYSSSSGLSPLFNTHGDNPLSSPITEKSDYTYQHDNIDPCSSERYQPDNKQLSSFSQPQTFLQPLSMVEPPTPAATPPPILLSRDQRFSEIRVTKRVTAVHVQDSLRGILDNHFPPTLGYSQCQFPSEDNRFWKRVLEDRDAEGRTVDQIIAIGCDEGVDKIFYEDISAQVERLGTKKSGFSRTGKLDIRYLIVNAMQTFTNQPLSLQTQNPLTNSSLLASLLIPHLESYLSLNSSSRFLVISFPAKHLATVLELRKLLGVDLLKIAGVIGTSSYHSLVRPMEALHAEHTGRKPSHPTTLMDLTTRVPDRPLNDAGGMSITRPRGHTTIRDCEQFTSTSFDQADFLLPSTATAIELDNFLSRITRCLVLKSDFYLPEIETPTPTQLDIASTCNRFPVESLSGLMQEIEAPPRNPDRCLASEVQARQAPRVRGLYGRVDRKNDRSISKAEQILGYDATLEISRDFPSLPSPSYPLTRSSPSAPVEDVSGNRETERRGSADMERYTNAGERTKEQEKFEREMREKSDKEWEEFDISKFEDDSEDEIERMLMPQPQLRRRIRKGNSRKALKWLGMA